MLYPESLTRDYDEMLDDAMERLEDKTGLTNFTPGGVARSLLEVYYEDMEDAYDRLQFATFMGFVSEAEGRYLDELGKLVDVERKDGEDKENYRYRISRANRTRAKANETAVRLACLSVEGVNDVLRRRFTRGTGTFDIYVVTDDPRTPRSVVDEVQEAIEDTQAYGIDGRAITPKLVELDMTVRFVFYDDVSEDEKRDVANRAEYELREFLVNLELGSSIIINQIIELLMGVSEDAIKNVNITDMYLDGKQVVVGDKELYWDERVVPERILIS